MSDVKNFDSQEAIGKLQELAADARIAMLCTNLTQLPFSTCPMSTQQVDETTGAIWFFSSNASQHNRDIEQDSRVQVIYVNNGDSSYLTVYGTAEILHDRAKIDELWTPLAKVWFQAGKDDADLRLIKVTPQEGFYWDTKHGKMVSFLKMMASIATGKTMDDGIQGSLSLNNQSVDNDQLAASHSGADVKAKMPTAKQTVKSMKGKTNEHDEDLLHGQHNPLDAVTDPAVNIIKAE